MAVGRAARGPGGWPLSSLLVLFGVSLLVPSLVAMALLLTRDSRSQAEQLERRVEQVASAVVNDIDRELALLTATLTAMAASPSLATGDFKAFHGWAVQILQPQGLHALYRDLDGQQQLNTRLAFGLLLPREMLPEVDAAVRATRKPYISDMLMGAVRRDFVVTITVPVLTADGTLRGFLHMSIDPERVLSVLQGQKLPSEWITGVADRKGVAVARLQRHEEHVGSQVPTDLLGNDGGQAFRSVSMDGVEVVRAVRVSRLSGWFVSAFIPVASVRAAFTANLWSFAGAAVLLALLTLALAVAVTQLITPPIRRIAGFAVMVEKESIPPPLRSPVREANEVAAALRFASGRLSERTRDLREVLTRFNAALRGADIVVFVQGLDRRISWISESAGYRARDSVGKREEDLLDDPEQRARAIALRERVFATGQPQEGELAIGKGEAARHFRQRLEPMHDEQGAMVGVLGVSMEVSALKRQQERNAMLVRELAHRSKNLLTIVQAIAGETLDSGGADGFRDRFGLRLQALAHLQDIVIAGARGGVELHELLRTQLAPFAEPGNRLEIVGPPVRLRPEAANGLGMAFHELATNATKYGSLSVPDGKVSISWRLEPDADGAQRIRLAWRESGGPPVVAPSRRGFGSSVVVDMATLTLDARVRFDHPSDGIVWHLDAPATILFDASNATAVENVVGRQNAVAVGKSQ